MDTKSYVPAEEVVELTRQLVRIPSHSGAPGAEKAVAEYIYAFAAENGLACEYDPVDGERKNVYVTLKGGRPGRRLLFNGHIDTVPPYEMDIPPYDAYIEDGSLWGRGANDMKGAVACMLCALLALKRSGADFAGEITVACVVGEEERSDGTERYVLSGRRADGAIVGEPSNYEYAIGHRGLEWLAVTVTGKSAHGGIPEAGVNAISKAADFIKAVERELYPRLAKRQNEYMGPSTMNFGTVAGGTQPSTVADRCVLTIDRRYVTGESVESVLAEYQTIIDGLAAKDPDFHAELSRMPENLMANFDHTYHYTPPEAAIVQSVRRVLEKHLGREPAITRKRGWTDAATLSQNGGIPTVITGPGNLAYSHTRNEHIPVADLVAYVDIYAGIALDFLNEA